MDGQLLGAGLGSAIGYLYAAGNSLKGKDAVLTGIAGAGAGGLVGLALEHIARVRARKEMRRRLAASPSVTDARLRALIGKGGDLKLPVYRQLSGEPIPNAYYMPNGPIVPGMLGSKDSKFLELTGKSVKPIKATSIPTGKPSIVIGRDFAKAPILAHELGHAEDFKERPNEKWKILGLSAAVGILSAGAIGGKYLAYRNVKDSLGTGTGFLLGAGIGFAPALAGYALNRRKLKLEEIASRKAMERLSDYYNGKSPSRLKHDAKLLESAYQTYDPLELKETKFS